MYLSFTSFLLYFISSSCVLSQVELFRTVQTTVLLKTSHSYLLYLTFISLLLYFSTALTSISTVFHSTFNLFQFICFLHDFSFDLWISFFNNTNFVNPLLFILPYVEQMSYIIGCFVDRNNGTVIPEFRCQNSLISFVYKKTNFFETNFLKQTLSKQHPSPIENNMSTSTCTC